MRTGFWKNLNTPILALAPLYDVTDAAFRQIIAKYGKPDVMYTEFVSAEGLASAGRERLMHHLRYEPSQRPIVAQIFGSHPEAFIAAARLINELGFDGIDVNFGCPDKNIMKQGSCAALFKQPKLAQEIIAATKQGAGELPVSVKIRIGDTKIEWESWIEHLLEAEPAAMAVHLRTRKEMSKVPAHWEVMPEIVQFINSKAGKDRPLIIGNGDVKDIAEAHGRIQESGCDGVMLGRGIFGNPWLFNKQGKVPTLAEKLHSLREHILLFDEYFSGIKNFDVMKKHFKAYTSPFPEARTLRLQLMETRTAAEAIALIDNNKTRPDYIGTG